MSFDPRTYCNCHLTAWPAPRYHKKDGQEFCKDCNKEVLPEDYCRCPATKRMGHKDQQVDGKVFCGNCQRELAWLPKVKEVDEDDYELVLTTIDYVPGHQITEVLGLVTQLVGSSGLTAGVKGREAKSGALRALKNSAISMDANAVIGIQFSAFGASGGLTNVFGGDAVGVLVSGTAVRIEIIEVVKTTSNPAE
jgi:uncharacterized protein YbjQ (UPF0145 family)